MSNALKSVLKQISERGLKAVRVVFVDQHGVTRGKTLTPDAFLSAAKTGVAMTSTLLLKDTSHATVFDVWGADSGFGAGVMTGASDFVIMPDAATFKILPWIEDTGWVLCDMQHKDGTPHRLSTRAILQKAIGNLNDAGMDFVAGLEVEFHVLEIVDDNLDHDTADWPEIPPTTRLINHGHQYLTENISDQQADIAALIAENAAALDLPIRSLETEFGPSQFEVTFAAMPALAAADTMVLFRNMVKQTCRRAGLHATFMCRPRFKNAMGSGWHLHQSVVDLKSGQNLFVPHKTTELTEIAGYWIAGLLAHAQSSCLLSTPTVNGYKRYQPFKLAPDRVAWGVDNRGAMLRALLNADDAASRIENRVGEPAANPYLYLATQIASGLDGITQRRKPPAAVENPYATNAPKLPTSLGDAIAAFGDSSFYRTALGAQFVEYFAQIKRAEWTRYLQAVSQWEEREYFSLF